MWRQRLGIPVKTVKTRLSRGLTELRTRLDAHCGGDRTRWIAALAPLCLAPLCPAPLCPAPAATASLTALTTGVLLMKKNRLADRSGDAGPGRVDHAQRGVRLRRHRPGSNARAAVDGAGGGGRLCRPAKQLRNRHRQRVGRRHPQPPPPPPAPCASDCGGQVPAVRRPEWPWPPTRRRRGAHGASAAPPAPMRAVSPPWPACRRARR